MIVALFVLALLLTVTITNKKNEAAPTDNTLEFGRSDSLVIFLCFVSSILFQILLPKIPLFQGRMLLVSLVVGAVYLMVLIIVNNNREKKIQHEHDQIIKLYQSMADIFGAVGVEDIDFANTPFKFEEDRKIHVVNSIVIDTSVPGLKINDNSIIYTQYSLNKYFPELQWTSEHDAPNRQLIYKGLPKPPSIANFPGSDYRPAGWIPLGLGGGNVEICWNLADQKEMGFSSYISEDGEHAETLRLPSAPQCLTLGSTGGGKAIWVDQMVDVL
jgi:hypothetical protein